MKFLNKDSPYLDKAVVPIIVFHRAVRTKRQC